jgi:ribonuclease P protein component
MGDQRLRPSERLRHPHEFQHVFRHGTKLVTSTFILHILPTSASCSRLGMAVSKRVGNAVVRNRVKRLIRELFRQHKAIFQPTCDVVFVARHYAAEASLEELTRQFLSLLRRCQSLRGSPIIVEKASCAGISVSQGSESCSRSENQ